MRRTREPKMIIGWREWLGLPDLGVPAIKAKVDTGAKTSTLHAFDVTPFEQGGDRFVAFSVHPLQGNDEVVIQCTAPLVDRRNVTSSTGQTQRRYVIATTMQVAGRNWSIELTLTNRDVMKFRMLLGRDAMKGRLIVDPQLSLQGGARKGEQYYPTTRKDTVS